MLQEAYVITVWNYCNLSFTICKNLNKINWD